MSGTEALGGEAQIDDSFQPDDVLDEATYDEGEPDQSAQEPEYEYLEVDDPSSKYVRVVIDGEEQSVPLQEALQGYSRTADYTRKTQELAEQRRQAEEAIQIQQALAANPGLTIQVLAQRQGMSVEEYLGMRTQQQPQFQRSETPTFDEDDYSDPLERQLAEERQARMALEERLNRQEANQVLMRAVDGLKQSYGISDEEARTVVGQALQMGLGPEAFPMIYQSQQYQRLQAERAAQQQVEEQRQQKTQQRQHAAARASQVVGSGRGVANVAAAAPSHEPKSVREAIELAFDELEAARTRR